MCHARSRSNALSLARCARSLALSLAPRRSRFRASERESFRSAGRASACRQHTSAYVSIRQHTSAYVSIRQHTSPTSAYLRVVSIRQRTSAYVSIRQHTCGSSAYVGIRQHTSAYVSIRQHTSAYLRVVWWRHIRERIQV
jgi:hypothetical protein